MAAWQKTVEQGPKLKELCELQRAAQGRLDFIAAENSMGFHAPQEVRERRVRVVRGRRGGEGGASEIGGARLGNCDIVVVVRLQRVRDFASVSPGTEIARSHLAMSLPPSFPRVQRSSPRYPRVAVPIVMTLISMSTAGCMGSNDDPDYMTLDGGATDARADAFLGSDARVDSGQASEASVDGGSVDGGQDGSDADADAAEPDAPSDSAAGDATTDGALVDTGLDGTDADAKADVAKPDGADTGADDAAPGDDGASPEGAVFPDGGSDDAALADAETLG